MLQSKLEEVQRGMENQALANVKTPPKVHKPKSTTDSPNANTSITTTTTIAKADLHKEKERVNVEQHKDEEKKDKAGKSNLIFWEFPRMKNPVRN